MWSIFQACVLQLERAVPSVSCPGSSGQACLFERGFFTSVSCAESLPQPSGLRGRSCHWHLDWLRLSPVLGVSSISSSPSSLRWSLECSGHSGEVSFFGFVQWLKEPESGSEVRRKWHMIFQFFLLLSVCNEWCFLLWCQAHSNSLVSAWQFCFLGLF